MATKTRETVREPIGTDVLLDRIMKLAGGVIVEMNNTPEGAEVFASRLRLLGWTCTPPTQPKEGEG